VTRADEIRVVEAGDGARFVRADGRQGAEAVLAVRATRNVPPELRTMAAPPTDARDDDESICTTTAVPLTLPFSEDSCGTLLGLDPPPPPHAAASEPSARHDAAWQAWMQKVLRSISVSCDMSSTSRAGTLRRARDVPGESV